MKGIPCASQPEVCGQKPTAAIHDPVNGVYYHEYDPTDSEKAAEWHTVSDDEMAKDILGTSAEEPEVGLKFDENKSRLDLIDSFFKWQLGKVMGYGAKKYSPHNWRKGIAWSRLIAAAERHLTRFNKGEETDPENGLPHLAEAAASIMMLLWHSKYRRNFDDRHIEPEDDELE